jgi:hypothetical protein
MRIELGRGQSPTRRLGVTLLLSFALTVASFSAATVVVDRHAQGISKAAASIANDAAPSIGYVSGMRTTLRHLEVTVDDYTDRIVKREPRTVEDLTIPGERRAFDQAWARYVALPSFPGEQAQQAGVNAQIRGLDLSLDRLFAKLNAGDG